jgi:adenine phosphoribosyltransferase
MDLENYIRDIQGFPKEGILFKDITFVRSLMRRMLANFSKRTEGKKIDKVVVRKPGFFGMLLAQIQCWFYSCKKTKLPY